jgi:hypothetical protein
MSNSNDSANTRALAVFRCLAEPSGPGLLLRGIRDWESGRSTELAREIVTHPSQLSDTFFALPKLPEKVVTDQEPVRIVLTPEQREQIKRVSGQVVDALEIDAGETKKPGGVLRFLWRLSAATGIPRQAWTAEDPEKKK